MQPHSYDLPSVAPPDRASDPCSMAGITRITGDSLHERIQSAMSLAGLNITDLSRATGTRWQTVQTWCKGHYRPSLKNLRKIAEATGVTAEELLDTPSSPPPTAASWPVFLEAATASGLTEAERRSLASIRWPEGKEPTLLSWWTALSALRVAHEMW